MSSPQSATEVAGLMKMEGYGGGVRPASLTIPQYQLHPFIHMYRGRTVLHVVQPNTSNDRNLLNGQRPQQCLNVNNLVRDLCIIGEDVVALDDSCFQATRLKEFSDVVGFWSDDGFTVVDSTVGGGEAD